VSERYRQIWDARFNEIDPVIEELKAKENSHSNAGVTLHHANSNN
jgi:hypothetical protein